MTPWIAPLVVFVLAVGFELFCLAAVLRAPTVRRLPRWGWAAVCVLCNPLGGLAFLTIGWPRQRDPHGATDTAT